MPLRLTLLRHAKSSWDHPGTDDFNRSLNKRGEYDSPRMGQLLKQNGYSPQIIFSSAALRAKATAVNVAAEIGIDAGHIRFREDIYLAAAQSLLNTTIEIAADYNNVLLIGHNPGVTDLANLISDARIDNLPTCGIISIVLNVDSWPDLAQQKGRVDWCLWPKKDLEKYL